MSFSRRTLLNKFPRLSYVHARVTGKLYSGNNLNEGGRGVI